ncbi:citryl-CoA lyase [Rugamonas sp. A1-17]|nr:citryl-CoA lyase [Rugamonas sp. A1-17]
MMDTTIPNRTTEDTGERDVIHTRIWLEEPEADNPFATRAAYCRGFDVFGDLVGKIGWIEMLLLLLRDERPDQVQVAVLEALAVAMANPGPRDASVHAAMCGAVGGSPAAASLIGALSVAAGRNGGARDVHDAMVLWANCGADLAAWVNYDLAPAGEPIQVWPAAGQLPGLEPHGVSTSTVVRQLLTCLSNLGAGPRSAWLLAHLEPLRLAFGLPLSLSGVAAAVLADLGLTPGEGEMLYLLLRLPGAAAHALEQRSVGFRHFPFYPLELDPNANVEAQ